MRGIAIMALHFAYGSNMSLKKMQKFAPKATVVSVACLLDWQLTMNHQWHDGSAKATIEPSANNEKVWGVLYRVNDDDVNALDVMERLGLEYKKQWVDVVGVGGGIYSAFAYVGLNPAADRVLPTQQYCQRILAGAHENGLPAEYIRETLQIFK
ncbi:MAG: gamma-glutamylcyclotransferase (GGCT)/AIG2-like uncharacterized protein YtfP [Candidatus Endobugula sp.]|jgi:gamma-glutamylcyclotransferase (GGCT)/AIG2-like uncharacterized protein YtfP